MWNCVHIGIFCMTGTYRRRVQVETALERQLEEAGLNKGHAHPAHT